MRLSALLAVLALAGALAAPAEAACYADYKAKQDRPLRLHYGVAQVPDSACNRKAATRVLKPRLEQAGWTLLNVLSTFGPEGLDERKASAGRYFLRY
ncbi:hypothetical protein ORIO_13775 [Cereibacter azotoformans]|uniref:Uncharacterized protein n=2 Tax=Cereibacter TaxID=1653176 RepID=A0A2T5JVE4_9RHOB|nr:MULTISPECIES: hypothetical protein [Cereibacter]AXQ94749.1 hypothetical protein D0Z66_13605 [Cereibacter sphaeroides]MBO4170393.1 hypothetical protein [Cereibacter azotoformans]PTR14048.1 hypothetical protein C8J28_11843 [Cereibacter azotoformans]UIJ30318.1 hypothetical protein LV780_13580 [Cereibacter azotoformans]ULB10972.1 hypothetical protein ORIO_13775 [Cereibacter azotoformans]